MKLRGRILWLTDDPALLRRQLDGDELACDSGDAPPLHFAVNTDGMISGAACTLGYTGDILGPYFLENFKEVVVKDGIKGGGFQVVVGGDAYGSGSSREVAVVAHQGAGIELVIARHELYIDYHHRAVAAVDTVVPVRQVLSIDETDCELTGRWREPERALGLARST